MYIRTVQCAVAILVLILRGSAAAGQSPTVDEIVASNLAAKGGAEKLRAVTSVKMTVKVKGTGGQMVSVSWAKRPNMMRRENTTDGQTFVLGFDGQTVWAINPLMGPRPREITGPQADMTRQDADDFDSLLLDYKAKGHTVELVGTEAVQGIKMHRLRVTKKTGSIQEIYLNAETGLESKVVMQVEREGRKGIVTSEFSNYKAVDGITVPFHIRQSFNGQVIADVSYDEWVFNVPIADSAFRMPK
jgi:outer membrane lipoprotein-sorting protein